jgi:hypothetical protein
MVVGLYNHESLSKEKDRETWFLSFSTVEMPAKAGELNQEAHQPPLESQQEFLIS